MKVLLALAVFFAIDYASAQNYNCQDRFVRCESIDYNYRNCRVADGWNNVVRDGYLVRQISKATCNRRSYRVTREGVEVSNGCRGDFRLRVCNRW